MSVSTRISIQWLETEPVCPPELTDTIVTTSPAGKFVDVRYFLKPKTKGEKEEPFEWFFSGQEEVISENVIKFDHKFFDSWYIEEFYKRNGKNISKNDFIKDDIGVFSDSFDSIEKEKGIRLEHGEMFNNKTNRIERYEEKWVSIDPYVIDSKKSIIDDDIKLDCIVMDVSSNDNSWEGRWIIVGNWCQGVIWEKNLKFKSWSEAVGCLRLGFNSTNNSVSDFIKWGGRSDKFPDLKEVLSKFNNLEKNQIWEVDGISWKVVEICKSEK